MNISELLPLIALLVVIQLGLLIYSLFDLTRRERRVVGGNKWVWGFSIVLVNILGPLVYLLVGREET